MRLIAVLWSHRLLNQIKRRAGHITPGIESIRVAQDTVVARPVRPDRDQGVSGFAVLGGWSQPARECLGELGFSRAGEAAKNQEGLFAASAAMKRSNRGRETLSPTAGALAWVSKAFKISERSPSGWLGKSRSGR